MSVIGALIGRLLAAAATTLLGPLVAATPLGQLATTTPLGPLAAATPLGPLAATTPLGPLAAATPLRPLATTTPLGPFATRPPLGQLATTPASPRSEESPAPIGQLRIVGRPETVFDWASQACEPAEVPDLPARAFRDYRGRVQLLLSHYENFRLIGRSLSHLRRDCNAVMRSPQNASPARFEDREWLASLFSADGRTIWALVDEEYQGNRHSGRCPSESYYQCWYNAVTVARSQDGGGTYVHQPAPRQLVAAPTAPYQGGGGPTGVFTPSNMVTGPGGAQYALVRVKESNGLHGDCLLRSTRVGAPGSWQAWDGEGFSAALHDPYAATPASGPGCAQVGAGDIAEMTESLTYNDTLGRYLLVGLAPPGPTSIGTQATGIYFSTSYDLIHWSRRTLIAPEVTTQTYTCGGASPIAYPSVIDPSSPSRTFTTSGSSPTLYYTQFIYSGCHQTPDRDLMRVQLDVSP
jgi:hypothetical protein